jgi:hypothetical protein
MSATSITLHKFFIDLLAVCVNNIAIKFVHTGEKRWNIAIKVK